MKMNWKKVSEELPEDYQYVLLCTELRPYGQPRRYNFYVGFRTDQRWIGVAPDYKYNDELPLPPTHWCELKKPAE